MSVFTPTETQIAQFHKDGYLVVRDLFTSEEVALLGTIGKADEELNSHIAKRRDLSGGVTTLSISNDLGDDIYSAIVRSRRMVDTMEMLLGDEVYHYHHKMNMKAPFVGGAWEWHQDYGYWYKNGCLTPDMASCMIAVDPANRENGCLQVIKGSHILGRIDHGKVADQTGADMERVNVALERMELVYCEMGAGDAVFFHSNLLHRSDQNKSPNPRWALICCYNTRSNDPYKQSHHPSYCYLEKWDDFRVMEVGLKQAAQLEILSGSH